MKTWVLLAAAVLAPLTASAQLNEVNENARIELIRDVEASRKALLPQEAPLPQVTVRFQPRLNDIKASITAARTPAELVAAQKDLADWKVAVIQDALKAPSAAVQGPQASYAETFRQELAVKRFGADSAAALEASAGSSWGRYFDNQSHYAAPSGPSVVAAPAPLAENDPARYKKLRDIAVHSWGADAKIVDAAIKEAIRQKVDPALVLSVIWQESRFNPRATSPVGARGLMQVMPATGRGMGYSEDSLYTVKGSLEAGIKYLKYAANYLKLDLNLSDISSAPDGKIKALLASYNAGIGAVSKWIRQQGAELVRIPYAETRHYVKVIGGKLASLGESLGW